MPDSAASASPGLPDPTEGPASDERLLTAVREGDDAAFGELYERHRAAVLAVARMHARHEADAQDLVSEAFTRVLGLLREGRGPREFLRTYLVTAVSRLAADRANDLSRTRPEEPRPDGPLDRVEFFDDVVVRQVDSAVVARAFASLPERWQEILWYLEVEGRRPRQVASVVGAQPNAVSALGKRAREGLRAAYMQEHVSAQALEDCHRYSSQLGAFARGSLTPSRTKVVQEHLDECRRCTAEYLQLQDLGLGMRGWLLPVLAGLPLWQGAGGRLADALAGLPLGGGAAAAGAAAATAAAHDAAGPAVAGTGTTSSPAGTSGGPAGVLGEAATLAGSGAGLAAGVVALAVVAASAVGFVALRDPATAPAPAAVSTNDTREDGRAASAAPSHGGAASPGARHDDAAEPSSGGSPASGPAAPGKAAPGAVAPGTAAPGSAEPGAAAPRTEGAGPADRTRPSGVDEHPGGAGDPRGGTAPPVPLLPDAPPGGSVPRSLPTPAASLPVALPTGSPTPDVVVPSPGTSPGPTGGATDTTPAPSDAPAQPSPQPGPDPSGDPCGWILLWCPPWGP